MSGQKFKGTAKRCGDQTILVRYGKDSSSAQTGHIQDCGQMCEIFVATDSGHSDDLRWDISMFWHAEGENNKIMICSTIQSLNCLSFFLCL